MAENTSTAPAYQYDLNGFRCWRLSSLRLNPYQLWYGQEGKMYSSITLLVLAATWFWWVGISRGGWRPWLAYLVTTSVALYTHLLIILLFPLHLLWFGHRLAPE